MTKRSAVFVTALLAVFLLAAATAQAKTVFRIAHSLAPTSHFNKGLLHLDELLKAKSKGEMLLDIYPAGQLGTEEEVIAGMDQGYIEMTLASSAPLVKKSKALMLFDLPFIIFDREKAHKWMDGPEGQKILDSLSAQNTLAVSFWANGVRHVTNSRQAINTPEDIKDMTIRTTDSPLNLSTFKTLQAVPMPIAAGEELFKALQEKTVDGQENSLETIFNSRFFEVQKYLTLTGHYYSPAVLLVNKTAWEKLSAANRAILIESINQARDWERGYTHEMDVNLVEELKKNGMEVTTPDKEAWVKAMEPVYAEFGEQVGKELVDSLIGTQNGTIPLPSEPEKATSTEDAGAKTETGDAPKTDSPDAAKPEAGDAAKTEAPDAAKTEAGDAAKTEAPDAAKEAADTAKPEATAKPDADKKDAPADAVKQDADAPAKQEAAASATEKKE